ncbi:MAG: RluA family pseudouridine synthase, partial [Bacilli bacterium]
MNKNKKKTNKKPLNTSKKEYKFTNDKKIAKEIKVNYPLPLMEFLLKNYKQFSRNNIKAMLGRKQILVNDIPTSKFDYQLVVGDKVSISSSTNKGSISLKDKIKIIYEDDDLIVINKQAGLLSIATDKEKEDTAYRYVNEYVRLQNAKNRIFVLHRLDKETSGILMFAKNEEFKEAMQKDWNNQIQKREYIAICEGGHFQKKEGDYTSYLMSTKTNLMYSTHDKEGQKAITHYQVLHEKDIYSLVRINIDTGRKNQIRVHMKDLGHQIVGDDKYDST